MPIYEYACKSCGHELEALQKMSEQPLTDCPECGRADLRKKVSAAGFRLKGSGWYETDFKKDKDKKKNLAGDGKSGDGSGGKDGSDAKSASKSEGKSESKSDSKSDAGTSKKSDSSSKSGASKSDA